MRSVKSLPAPLRAYLAERKNQVVYSYTDSGKTGYAVFNSKSDAWKDRAVFFGPKGQRLSQFKTPTDLDSKAQDRAEKKWADGVRSFFKIRTLNDIESLRGLGHFVTKVRSVKSLPPPLRAYLAGRNNRVVYSYTYFGRKGYAVFSSKASGWGARVVLFGPKGQRIGTVTTRTDLDPWEQDQVDAFENLPGQAQDDGSYADQQYRTHFGRNP